MNIFKYLFNTKYRFFYQKMGDVKRTIWEMDFKVAKSRQIREGVRQDRDRVVEALGNAKKAEQTEDVKKQVLGLEETQKRYEAQMEMIDKQITGYTAQNDNEESVIGVNEQIASYAELREMYRQYLTTI